MNVRLRANDFASVSFRKERSISSPPLHFSFLSPSALEGLGIGVERTLNLRPHGYGEWVGQGVDFKVSGGVHKTSYKRF